MRLFYSERMGVLGSLFKKPENWGVKFNSEQTLSISVKRVRTDTFCYPVKIAKSFGSDPQEVLDA